MLSVAIFFGFIVIATVLFGQIAHVRASPEKLVWYMQIKEWKSQTYAMVIFLVAMALLFILMGFSKASGWKLPSLQAQWLLIFSCLAALWYLGGFARKFLERLASYKTPIKLLGGWLAVCLVTASKVGADKAIAELTNLPPQEFPGAQMLLTLVFQPVIVFISSSVLLGYLSIPATLLLLAFWIYKEFKVRKGEKPTTLTLTYASAILAIMVPTVTMLAMSSNALNKRFYEKPLRIAIAYSAFHLPLSYCGLSNVEGAAVAQLNDRRAALAMPDEEKGYVFDSIPCLDSTQEPAANE
jgi:hypothetical protein